MEILIFSGIIFVIYLIITNDGIVKATINFFVIVFIIGLWISSISVFFLLMSMIESHEGERIFLFTMLLGVIILLLYTIYRYKKNIFNFLNSQSFSAPVLKSYTVSPLYVGVKIEFFERFFKYGANVNSKDKNGNTVLHKVVQQPNVIVLSLIHFLLKKGARIDIKNNQGFSVLELASYNAKKYFDFEHAIRSDDEERVELLLKSQDLNLKNYKYLSIASIIGNIKIIELLLNNGADIEETFDNEGYFPLALAALYGHYDAVKLLLDNGADILKKLNNGQTVLHIVSLYGYYDIAELFIKQKLSVDIKDNQGYSSLWYAEKYNNKQIVSLLKKHSKKLFIKKLFYGFLLFIFISIVSTFLYYPNTIKNELYKYSIEHQYVNIADFLSKFGASAKIHNIDLEKISQNKNLLKFYIKHHSLDINKQDKSGKTILHYAYEYTTPEIIKLLVENGADENILDKNAKKPCFYSIYNSDQNITICPESCEGKNTIVCNKISDKYDMTNNTTKAKQIFTITCKHNSSYGCFKLGEIFDRSTDMINAIASYKKSCTIGYIHACKRLSNIADNMDASSAMQLYKLSCDRNVTKSCAMLGLIYKQENEVKNINKSQYFFKKSKFNGEDFFNLAKKLDNKFSNDLYKISCDKNYKKACLATAKKLYSIGLFRKAFQFYKKSCKLGDTKSCAMIGLMYKYGEGTKKNNSKAVYYFKKATVSDLTSLALSMPDEKAKDLYVEACKKNYKFACEKIVSIAYENDKEHKYKKAFKLYNLGCKHNVYWGCNNLGVMYDNGKWIKKNHKQAAKLFKKACNNENYMACNNLGLKYQYAQGVRQNDAKAMKLYSKACDGGISQACYNLGNMYRNKYDFIKSQEFYRKACDAGYKEACSKISSTVWQKF